MTEGNLHVYPGGSLMPPFAMPIDSIKWVGIRSAQQSTFEWSSCMNLQEILILLQQIEANKEVATVTPKKKVIILFGKISKGNVGIAITKKNYIEMSLSNVSLVINIYVLILVSNYIILHAVLNNVV
jgi:hypothetical protein